MGISAALLARSIFDASLPEAQRSAEVLRRAIEVNEVFKAFNSNNPRRSACVAAEQLNIGRASLYRLIESLGLKTEDFRTKDLDDILGDIGLFERTAELR